MNFKKYHVSRNLLDWSGNLSVINGTVTTNREVLSSMIDVSNINTLYFTGVTNLMNSGVYRLAKSNSIITSGSTVDSYSSNFTGGSYDVSDCNFLLVTASVYGKPAENAQLIKSSYMCNVGSTPLPYEPYSSEVWHDIPHYIHNTSTDTITTLPAVLYPTGTTATVGVKGQTTQSSIPSPTSPIMPQGTGAMSSNLVNIADFTATVKPSSQDKILWTGNLPVGTYTFSINQDNDFTSSLRNTIHLKIDSASYYENATGNYHNNSGRHTYTFTVSDSTATVTIYYWTNTISNECSFSQAMLNTGETALPYDKYGQYKIPISSANTTTPVYLGEVETTRKIKKLVLTGKEDWENSVNPTLFGVIRLLDLEPFIPQVTAYCSHYIYSPIQSGLAANMVNGEFALQKSSNAFNLYIRNTDYTTRSNFKDYLAAQYAAGTPVTVWYVLATEETGIVNEPLMRIGNYADSLTTSIPCTAGANTLDVQTTVQPSEVTAEFSGWHPVSAAHERENGQWD